MTTPERLRRRQRIEGAGLLLLGIFIAAQSWYFDNRDEDNDRRLESVVSCMADNFTKFSVSINARGNLSQRDSDAVAELLSTVAAAKTSEQVADALQKYDTKRRAIAKDRRENPLPKFPTGRCDASGNNLLPREGTDSLDGLGPTPFGRVAGLAPVDVTGSPSPLLVAPFGGIVHGERQPNPGRGQPAGGSAGADGNGPGGSSAGGGGGQPAGGLGDTLDRVVPGTGRLVKDTLKVVDGVVTGG